MAEWKVVKLADVCTVLNGRAYSQPELLNSGKYKVVRVGNLVGGDRFYYSDMELDEDKYCLEGDLLYAWACSFDSYIWKEGKTIFHYHIWKLLPKEDLLDKKFFYFYLKRLTQKLLGKTNGSVMQHITKNLFENTVFPLPPLPTQQKIAAILSSLDDRIELNNKINTNLEQQAQALFKNWFVDFEPFGGKMPEGWKVGKLSEYCNFQEGYVNPAQTHNEYFDGDVKWLRAVDINESFIINTSRTLTKCGFESAGKSAFLFKPGSIAISKSGTVGRLGIISDFMCGNRAVIGIEIKEQQNLSFIHQYLKSRQTEFPDMAVGSVQKNLYVSILENLDIIIPSRDVLEKYAKICMPFYDQIKTNCIESNNLISIRNTLLPKLMNGEIEV